MPSQMLTAALAQRMEVNLIFFESIEDLQKLIDAAEHSDSQTGDE